MKAARKAMVFGGLCFLFLVFSPSVKAAGELFDFGPEDSPLAPGFVRVTEKDIYTAERGFGWKGDLPLFSRNENFAASRASLKLDALISDHVTGGQAHHYPEGSFSFQVDLPKGEYVGALILGKLTETHATTINRPPFWHRNYAVKANGEEIIRVEGDWLDHLREFHSAAEVSFLPGDSIFERFVLPFYRPRFFSFTSEGNLVLELSAVCPINALLIFPKEKEGELKKRIERWKEDARSFMDNQYKIDKREEVLCLDLKERYTPQGYILFTRAHEEVHPYTRPGEEEVNKAAARFTSPGEKARLTFSLLPLRDLQNVRITLTDLVSEAGSRIPRENLDLWLGRYILRPKAGVYQIRPWLSFPFSPTDFPSLITQNFFLYVRVPEDTPAGTYQGRVKISSENAPSSSLPLAVKVLPFRLREPDMLLGMYSYHPRDTLFRFVRPASEEEHSLLREKTYNIVQDMFLEMKEAGFNTASPGMPWHPFRVTEAGDIVPAREPRFPGDDTWGFWEDTISLYQKTLGNNPLSIFGMGWSCLVHPGTVPGFITRNPDQWEKEGFSEEAIERAEKLITHFYQQVTENNWPEVIFYMSDELSNLGMKGGKFGRELASIYRKIADRVGFRILASMNGPPEHQMVPYLDIATPNHGFPITEETIEMIEEAGADLWFFNVGTDRFSFGFYLTRTRPRGRLQWAFGPGYRYLNQTPSLPSLGMHLYMLPLDSNLNVGRRYDIRQMAEGILDYRYYLTLEGLVKENKGTNNPALAKAVKKAERLLTKITAGVEVDARHHALRGGAWEPEVCERLRWMLASSIMEVLDAKQ